LRLDSGGKLVVESILETKAATILQFFAGLRETLRVTFEEGTCAAWLYDLLKPHVAQLVVCNPRKNALLKYHGRRLHSRSGVSKNVPRSLLTLTRGLASVTAILPRMM
jgi:hypothetical protein